MIASSAIHSLIQENPRGGSTLISTLRDVPLFSKKTSFGIIISSMVSIKI